MDIGKLFRGIVQRKMVVLLVAIVLLFVVLFVLPHYHIVLALQIYHIFLLMLLFPSHQRGSYNLQTSHGLRQSMLL